MDARKESSRPAVTVSWTPGSRRSRRTSARAVCFWELTMSSTRRPSSRIIDRGSRRQRIGEARAHRKSRHVQFLAGDAEFAHRLRRVLVRDEVTRIVVTIPNGIDGDGIGHDGDPREVLRTAMAGQLVEQETVKWIGRDDGRRRRVGKDFRQRVAQGGEERGIRLEPAGAIDQAVDRRPQPRRAAEQPKVEPAHGGIAAGQDARVQIEELGPQARGLQAFERLDDAPGGRIMALAESRRAHEDGFHRLGWCRDWHPWHSSCTFPAEANSTFVARSPPDGRARPIFTCPQAGSPLAAAARSLADRRLRGQRHRARRAALLRFPLPARAGSAAGLRPAGDFRHRPHHAGEHHRAAEGVSARVGTSDHRPPDRRHRGFGHHHEIRLRRHRPRALPRLEFHQHLHALAQPHARESRK